MADERLRALERQAEAGDPEARSAWLKELERVADPRAVAIREREARLQEQLDALRVSVDALIERRVPEEQERGRCRGMSAVLLRGVLRAALEGKSDYGFGFKTLSQTWPRSRSARGQIELFEERDDPVVVMAFAGRLDDEVVLRLGTTVSRKPTPGTTWDELSPWRANLRPETWRKRLRAWIDYGAPAERTTLEQARLWLDLTDLEATPAPAEGAQRVINLDAPSEKQLGFIRSLARKKHLTEARLSEVLAEHGGVKLLDYLARRDASKVIDALLELPDPPKGARRPKAPKEKTAAPAKTASKKSTAEKLLWRGRVLAVQPRIKLTRLRGKEQHGYQGFALRLEGTVGGEPRRFSVGIGKAAQARYGFQAGDTVSGAAVAVAATAHEATDYYKASKLELEAREPQEAGEPPWLGPPPELTQYRERGHRPLGEEAYAAAPCSSCIWACLMPAEDREDDEPKRSLETHCYGPKACSAYQPF